jgi:hypothetical protein
MEIYISIFSTISILEKSNAWPVDGVKPAFTFILAYHIFNLFKYLCMEDKFDLIVLEW